MSIVPIDSGAGQLGSAGPAVLSGVRLPLVYLLLGALVLAPLACVSVPALVDYPNHLARLWILAHPHAAAGQNYLPHWQLIPTLAMDLIVPVLAQFMPIEIAGRIFVALTLIVLVLGTVSLQRVLWGRVGLWPLCSMLFLYNEAFHFGFLNYLFGLGLTLLAFSGWVATEDWRPGPRLVAFSLVGCLLFVVHLFAFGIYGLLVASYEAGDLLIERRRSWRDLCGAAVRLAQFAAPVLLWVSTRSNGGPRHTEYGTLAEKLRVLLTPFAYGGVSRIAIPICIGLLYVGWRSGALTVAPKMRLALGVLVVAAALMPEWLFGSWSADIRLPIALSFIVVGVTRLRLSRVVGIGLGLVALTFLAVRVYAITADWQDMDRRMAEYRAAAAQVPLGSRFLVVQSAFPDSARRIAGAPAFLAARDDADFTHLVALSIIDRGIFMPYLFSGWEPVRPQPRNAGLYQTQGLPLTPRQLLASAVPDGVALEDAANDLGEPAYWLDWPHKFDFVLWLDFGQSPATVPPALQPWAAGSFFHLYKINPR